MTLIKSLNLIPLFNVFPLWCSMTGTLETVRPPMHVSQTWSVKRRINKNLMRSSAFRLGVIYILPHLWRLSEQTNLRYLLPCQKPSVYAIRCLTLPIPKVHSFCSFVLKFLAWSDKSVLMRAANVKTTLAWWSDKKTNLGLGGNAIQTFTSAKSWKLKPFFVILSAA